ncbi:dethiobiotin synthase [Glaciimonas immobilis]|uniref:ATP-dependent dethiobiotin synthetase BioD n=1 Tax=Glaciimonas immobilis TaxID=728004 RepID=A0A840RRA7_9BURK|nr:dethiobiotin synthase [Glaciimonas immobilis]KAF3996876.1 dethiobiotin synthase [Glaciimonas immobilis]MBB5199682.1 dethiobiotin synthetase [Glaciimonas immobilis]
MITSINTPRCAYFVAGTDTEIGKTLVASSLLHALTKTGVRTAGMKPVAAGAELRDGVWHNEDADALAEQASIALPPALATPYLFAQPTAPHIAAALEDRVIALPHILSCYQQIAALADAVVVEGVGGFRVPLNQTIDTADMAQQLGLPVVLVVGLRLGCISHALLTVEAIAARGLQLAGWVINTVDPTMLNSEATVDALLARIDAPFLGRVPRMSLPTADLAAAAAGYLQFSHLPGWPAGTPLLTNSLQSKEI